MSRRILVAGGGARRRDALARCLDATFDVLVEKSPGPMDAMRRLPNADFGLMLVLADADEGEARGIELVRFVAAHARHAGTPVALLGGTAPERDEARGCGARLMEADASDAEVRALARDLLGLG